MEQKNTFLLNPVTNVFLIIFSLLISIFLTLVTGSEDSPQFITGGVLWGITGGLLQLKSYNANKNLFRTSRNAFEFRKALISSIWGKIYTALLYVGSIAAIILSINSTSIIVNYLICYFSMMFVRESITLKSTFEIKKAVRHNSDS